MEDLNVSSPQFSQPQPSSQQHQPSHAPTMSQQQEVCNKKFEFFCVIFRNVSGFSKTFPDFAKTFPDFEFFFICVR